MTFHLDNNETGSFGATLMKDSFSATNNSITVKTISLNTLFHRILHVRENDYVILKVDIEGAEFEVMRNLLSHSMLHLVDILAVEWHDESHWVFGQNKTKSLLYKQQKECINWVIEDSKVKNLEWA